MRIDWYRVDAALTDDIKPFSGFTQVARPATQFLDEPGAPGILFRADNDRKKIGHKK
ncbi:hypothetical protein JQ609_15945 [Bradyrhizobium sp. AUGA SZCCT0169]|uniref:hypothetical protein n=1 Tax=Bradyrhizobium sp. AUGA SZCCT0169 TaxID=2807663 RepID=UPI001BA888F8|nr:hypothetical protein [Bradyrhizobium sp. AUGA SZCCT0169]MBR1248415.1 hypothetical protein [Bradyrhizobium sp. AUGA SZCCT0169]